MASTRYTGEDATLRGWLLPDARFTAGTLNDVIAFGVPSSGTPRAGGVGTPGRDDMAAVVQATGEQGEELRIEALRGGLPRVATGVRFGYRLASENPDRMRGWQPPNWITGCVPIDASAASRNSLSLVTLRTGDLVCAYRQGTTLQIRTFDPSTLTWSAALTAPAVPGATSAVSGPLTLGIDGLGYVYLLVSQSQGWSLWRSASPDTLADGWIETARSSFGLYLPTAATDRMRLFILPNGDMALFEFYAAAVGGYVRQYASSDGGATWIRVAQTANLTTNLSDAIMLPSGRLGVARVDAAGTLTWSSSGSAWAAALNASTVTVSTTVYEAWLGYDPVGRIYAWYRDASVATPGAIFMSASDDDGSSWEAWTYSINHYNADTGQGLTFGSIAPAGGAFYLLHQSYDSVGTFDPSPILTRLGGWSGHVWIGGSIAIDAQYEDVTLGSGDDLGAELVGRNVASALRARRSGMLDSRRNRNRRERFDRAEMVDFASSVSAYLAS